MKYLFNGLHIIQIVQDWNISNQLSDINVSLKHHEVFHMLLISENIAELQLDFRVTSAVLQCPESFNAVYMEGEHRSGVSCSSRPGVE